MTYVESVAYWSLPLEGISPRSHDGRSGLISIPQVPLSRSLVSRQSLFSAKRTFFEVPYVSPRDVRGVLNARAIMVRDLKGDFDFVLSTGAALALAGAAFARRRRIPFVYVESVSRFDGPSLTGKMLAAGVRGASLFTQHEAWAGPRWRYESSLLDAYTVIEQPMSERPLRIFVTLGTIRPYRFDRLIRQIETITTADDTLIWQLGESMTPEIRGEVHQYMAAAEFDDQCQRADVVVSHAGVGSLLRMAELGIRPIAVPRRADFGEHVDDHQEQAAAQFGTRNLAWPVEADRLTRHDLLSCPAEIRETV